MKKIAVVGAIVTAGIVLTGLFLPSLSWDGAVTVHFRFHVVGHGDNHPIRGARIRVIAESQLHQLSDANSAGVFPDVTTDATGSATITIMSGAGGSGGLFGRTGRFLISHELLVEAEGYRLLSTALANVVGGSRFPISKRDFDVELVLFKDR